jgi:hypothetical protein
VVELPHFDGRVYSRHRMGPVRDSLQTLWPSLFTVCVRGGARQPSRAGGSSGPVHCPSQGRELPHVTEHLRGSGGAERSCTEGVEVAAVSGDFESGDIGCVPTAECVISPLFRAIALMTVLPNTGYMHNEAHRATSGLHIIRGCCSGSPSWALALSAGACRRLDGQSTNSVLMAAAWSV